MSRKSESAKLHRRPVHQEEDTKDGEGIPAEETDPFVLKEGQEGEQDWGVDDDDWGPAPGVKAGKETPATTRRRILRRSGTEIAFALVVHLALLCFYIYAHVYDATIFKKNNGKGFIGSMTYGGRWKYLTYIDYWLQFVYFFLAFFTDIMPHSPAKMWFRKLCDFLFTTAAFPMAVFVTVTFWGLYAIDRKLVYPAEIDEYIPTLLNHFWHTTIFIGVVIEMVLVFHRYPANMTAATVIFIFSTGYIIWMAIILTVDGYWVYPFMRLWPLPVVLIFFMFSYFITMGIYFLGKKLAYIRWKARHEMMDELYLGIHFNDVNY